MQKKPRVGVDVDGVLADLITPMFELMNRLLHTSYSVEHMEDWSIDHLIPADRADEFWRELGKPGLHAQLKPHPGAVEGIRALSDVADVYIVTSYLHGAETWVYERDAWLHKHFGIPRAKIVHTRAKYTFYGRVLVDDKPENVVEWQAEHPHGAGVLWLQPYNRRNDDARIQHRTDRWDEVIRLATAGASASK